MKTKILFLFAIFIYSEFAAQNDTIIYNFYKGIFENCNIKPKYGKPVVFKIININRFYYNPVVEGIVGETIDETIGGKAPAQSSNANRQPPTSGETRDVVDMNKGIYKVELKAVPEINNELIKKELENYSKDNTNTSFRATIETSLTGIYKSYKNKLNALSHRQQIYVYILNKINSNYNNYLDKINTPDLTYKIYKKIYDDANRNNDSIFEKASILNVIDLKKRYVTLNQYQEVKFEFQDFLNSEEVYNIIQAMTSSGNDDIAKNIKSEIDDWKKYISSTDADIKAMNLHKKLNFVEIINRILLDKASYEFTSIPIQAYGDFLNFDVDIKEKKKTLDDYTIYNSVKKFSHKEFVRGGMRLDFGIGVSFDFGKKDESYTISEKNNTDRILLNETKSDYAPKLVGLLHATSRSSTNLAMGFSLGTALDVANFDINSIYVGPSLLWGRSDKVIFTIGPSFKKIKQLNPEFQKYTTENLPSNFNLDASKYVDNYKIGVFLAITYNLTKNQRGKFLQETNTNIKTP